MKSLNIKCFILMVLPLLMVGSTVYATVGQEGRGGQTMDLNGKPSLRDLVDKTVCVWTPSTQFIKGLSYYPQMLKGVSANNWRFAEQIDAEANSLSICVTQGPLQFIPDGESVGVTIYTEGVKQVAIRLDQHIYIDRSIFQGMTAHDQAYLMLHESMHSFVGDDVTNRMIKLRSFVNYLSLHETTPADPKDLAYQATQDDVALPEITARIQSLKPEFETALNASAPILDREIAVSKILDADAEKPAIATQESIILDQAWSALSDTMNTALKSDDVKTFASLISKGFNANVSDGAKGSLLDLAINNCKTDIVDLLLASPNVDVNGTPKQSDSTPLMLSLGAHCAGAEQSLLARKDLKLVLGSVKDYDEMTYMNDIFQNADLPLLKFFMTQDSNYVVGYFAEFIDLGGLQLSPPVGDAKMEPLLQYLLDLSVSEGKDRVNIDVGFELSDLLSSVITAGDLPLLEGISRLSTFDINRGDLNNGDYTPLMSSVRSKKVALQEFLLQDPKLDINAVDTVTGLAVNKKGTNPQENGSIPVNTALTEVIYNAPDYGAQAIPLIQAYLARKDLDLVKCQAVQITTLLLKLATKEDKPLYQSILALLN